MAKCKARRCSVKFTGEEDVIKSVNYFVVGNKGEEGMYARKTQIRSRESISIKNSPLVSQIRGRKMRSSWRGRERERGDPKCIRRRNSASLLITANFRLHRGRRTKCNCPLCQSTISARGGRQMASLVGTRLRAKPEDTSSVRKENFIISSINFEDLSL